MKCPQDHAELEAQNYEADTLVDVCTKCGGMWLDEGELERIQEATENDYAAELARMPDLGFNAFALARAKSGRVLDCPKCGSAMETLEHGFCSQVLVDACTKCHGVWLDRGEIEGLEVFFERSRIQAGEMRQGFFASLRSLFG